MYDKNINIIGVGIETKYLRSVNSVRESKSYCTLAHFESHSTRCLVSSTQRFPTSPGRLYIHVGTNEYGTSSLMKIGKVLLRMKQRSPSKSVDT